MHLIIDIEEAVGLFSLQVIIIIMRTEDKSGVITLTMVEKKKKYSWGNSASVRQLLSDSQRIHDARRVQLIPE